jgi:hypothetical protein
MLALQSIKNLWLWSLLFSPLAFGQNATEQDFNRRRTLSIGYVRAANFRLHILHEPPIYSVTGNL